MKLKSAIALLLTISLTLLSVGCLSFPKSSYRATKEFDLGNFPSIKVVAPVNIIVIRNLSGAEMRFAVKYNNCQVKFDDYNRWVSTVGGMFEKAFLETFDFAVKGQNTEELKLSCNIYDFSVNENNIFTLDASLTLQYANFEKKLRKIISTKVEKFEAPFVADAAKKCMYEYMKYSANEINIFVKGVKK